MQLSILISLDCTILGVETQLGIHPPDDTTLCPETQLSFRIRPMKLGDTEQSEGYETMTPDSSDILSEVKLIL